MQLFSGSRLHFPLLLSVFLFLNGMNCSTDILSSQEQVRDMKHDLDRSAKGLKLSHQIFSYKVCHKFCGN